MGNWNQDKRTVSGFGEQWTRFDQSALTETENQKLFQEYFSLIEWSADARVLDMGCGSGRWAKLVAPRCKELVAADASEEALAVARQNLANCGNVSLVHASPENLPDAAGRFDLIYSLGVLHHIPDTSKAIHDLAARLNTNGQLLLYLYYAFDNRPMWYRMLWRISDLMRRLIASLPFAVRSMVCDSIAATVYWPMARIAFIFNLPRSWPLSVYRDRSFYTMRTDALDRFGTKLEKRFTQKQIEEMVADAGLTEIRFSPNEPYWVVCGRKD